MLCTRAADNLAIVCYVNLVGAQDEIVYDGCSLVVDEQGQVLAEGKMFEQDLPHCIRITRQTLRERPIGARVLSWLALLLRNWL